MVLLCLIMIFLEQSCIAFITTANIRRSSLILSLSPTEEFLDAYERSLKRETFVSLELKSNRKLNKNSTSIEVEENAFERLKSVNCRPVLIKDTKNIQLNYRYATRDETKNFLPIESINQIKILISSGFRNGKIKEVTCDHELSIKRSKGKFRTINISDENGKRIIDLSHDRSKNSLLDSNQEYLKALDVTSESGRPKVGMADKLRQIRKFVEITDNLIQKYGMEQFNGKSKNEIKIVDMGCGLGYLTFAIHAHLSKKYDNYKINTIGVEARPKLVERTNKIAKDLGDKFDSLRFVKGYIGENVVTDSSNVVIALHACDIATDEAIYEGINQQAEMIIVAPCCHKEVRRYIEMKLGDEDNIEVAFGHLSALMDHGIYRERTCEMVTDTMRALCLELAGYETKVFEFIGGEHTAKNVMITAVARENDKDDEDDSSERKIKIRRKLRRLAQYFGIESPKLAVLMGEAPLCSSVCKAIKSTKNKKRSIRRLRPLDNDDDERSDIDGDHEILDYKFSSWTKAIL